MNKTNKSNLYYNIIRFGFDGSILFGGSKEHYELEINKALNKENYALAKSLKEEMDLKYPKQ